MRRITLFLICLVLQFLGLFCLSQDIPVTFKIPYGLKQDEWNKVQKSWTRNNHPVMINKSDGTSHSGQILFINNDIAVLWTDTISFITPYNDEKEIVTFETMEADPSSFDLIFGLRISFLLSLMNQIT